MGFDSFKRNYLYRDNRPNWLAQLLNNAWRFVASSGIAPNWLVTLEVTGRKSGRTIAFPVVLGIYEGQRYLVSMLGEDAQWVKNVRAAGGRAAIRAGRRQQVRLEDVPAAQRAPLLKAYLQRAPGARPHIPVSKDAPVADFEPIAALYPVFRIVGEGS